MKTRLFSTFLALAMCLTLLPVAAMAEDAGGNQAKIGTTEYLTLADAVAHANDNDTITLLRNCEGGGIGLFADTSTGKCGVKKLTINFGGFTYTMNGQAVGSTGTESQSMHFEVGSDITLQNGTLEVIGGSMGIQNYGTLKLIDFNVDASGNSKCGYAV